VHKYDLQNDDSFIVVKTLLQSSCRAVLLLIPKAKITRTIWNGNWRVTF